MIIIQDQLGTNLVQAGHDVEINAISHQQFLEELNNFSTQLNQPLLDLMSGQMPMINVQFQNRGIANFMAQLVGVSTVNCVAQYQKLGAQPGVDTVVYVIQPVGMNAQATNFERDTAIYRCYIRRSNTVKAM